MRALVWFRSDLRIRDNVALHRACRDGDNGVVGVFAICAAQWAEHAWGSAKVDFVLRNVAALSAELARLNIPLLILRADRFDGVAAKLSKLTKKHACDALYFNEEYEVNEQQRDAEVIRLFDDEGRAVHTFTDQTILNVGELRTKAGGWYTVFTPFKKTWCAELKESGPPPVLPIPRRQQKTGIEADPVPQSLKLFGKFARPDLWPEGEKAAGKQLDAFVADRISAYEKARDFPAADGTSMLSPCLAAGVISPRQCLHAALDANNGRVDSGRKGPATWISELIWREFYRHVLIGFPRVCKDQPFKPETARVPWRHDEQQFSAWCEGRTGFPVVDAAMRQLSETGWMHNRLRMVAAMFLTKDLFIDWRWGERYFLEKLVDGDFASNNGGWQWSASTGTDAAPYFRIFNPTNQSKRFDPKGDFIRRYVPELADTPTERIHAPHEKGNGPSSYPRPTIERQKTRERVLTAFKRLRS